MKEKSVSERGHVGMKRYLSIKGYEILDENFDAVGHVCDFIAKDWETDELVFLWVRTKELFEFLDDGNLDELDYPEKPDKFDFRKIAEKTSLLWVLSHDDVDTIAIRFDFCSILVKGSDKMMLKHHINILNSIE